MTDTGAGASSTGGAGRGGARPRQENSENSELEDKILEDMLDRCSMYRTFKPIQARARAHTRRT